MLRYLIAARTALAPVIWGTTYLITTTLLPADAPLLASVLRALPAGVLLLLLTRTLPSGDMWWKSMVLGAVNIGIFFPLLFLAAYRLPGGVAATLGAIQPLIVQTLAVRLLGERLRVGAAVSGVAGLLGVALLVLRADARLDPIGVGAALAGACSMAVGIILSKRWMSDVSPLASTAWQLIWGGALIAPLLLIEGLPSDLSRANIAGFAYLSVIGGALAYSLWFAGIPRLPATTTSFLGLLSPLVAAFLGWAVLGQGLSAGQAVGALLVLGALGVVLATSPPSVAQRATRARHPGGSQPRSRP